MKKRAFTLAEILIVLIIIALIAVAMITTMQPKRFDDKANLASARKATEAIQSAIVQMLDIEQSRFPTKSFMTKIIGGTTWEFTALNSSNNAASANDIATLLGNYLKYQTSVVNFCDYSGYCSGSDYKGARLADGVYFGVGKYSSIQDCPNYRIPGESDDTAVASTFSGGKVQCWGRVFIDVNGNEGPNTWGSDVFAYGLGEFGIVR